MKLVTAFCYEGKDGIRQQIDLLDFHSIEIHFRHPDGATLVTFQGAEKSYLLPSEMVGGFLHWLAEI